MKKILFLFIFFLFSKITFASFGIIRNFDGVPLKHEIMFFNLDGGGVLSIPDSYGNFTVPNSFLTSNPTTNTIELIMCRNSFLIKENISVKKSRYSYYCDSSTKSKFFTYKNLTNLDIYLMTEKSGVFTQGLTVYCESKKSYYCSFTLINDNFDIILNKEVYSNFTSIDEDYIYIDPINLGSGNYTLSTFMTNNSKNFLSVISFSLFIINITNPYPEKANVQISLEKSGCQLINGSEKVVETLKPYESKKVPLIDKSTSIKCEPNKIEVNINIENFSIFSFSFFEISILGGITLVTLILVVFYIRTKKKKY